METVLILLSAGLLCSGCFLLGARVGQAVSRNEQIRLPKPGPAFPKKEEKNPMDTILRNIEHYDGTALGQEDVPGRDA